MMMKRWPKRVEFCNQSVCRMIFFFGIIDASYSTSDTCGQQYVKKVTRINFFFLHIFQLRCINALLPDNHDI